MLSCYLATLSYCAAVQLALRTALRQAVQSDTQMTLQASWLLSACMRQHSVGMTVISAVSIVVSITHPQHGCVLQRTVPEARDVQKSNFISTFSEVPVMTWQYQQSM
jgi:predicted deacetylase